jgi:hypothetical protein
MFIKCLYILYYSEDRAEIEMFYEDVVKYTKNVDKIHKCEVNKAPAIRIAFEENFSDLGKGYFEFYGDEKLQNLKGKFKYSKSLH